MVMLGSVAMVAEGPWNPVAGPPVRISRLMPVFAPLLVMRLPETTFFLVSIL